MASRDAGRAFRRDVPEQRTLQNHPESTHRRIRGSLGRSEKPQLSSSNNSTGPVRIVSKLWNRLSTSRFALAAFLIPLGIRAVPEIIVGPYPVGWDTVSTYCLEADAGLLCHSVSVLEGLVLFV